MSSAKVSKVCSTKRHFTVYRPNIWADNFLAHISHSKTIDRDSTFDEMREEIRKMIQNNTDELFKKLKLIDITQRLGIAYHFEPEIENELNKIYIANSKDCDDNLYNVALRFRLFREHGFKASCDVFENFKDDSGKFKESLTDDIKGMLSLYEAAFLSIRGEDILDEAIAFTTKNLQVKLSQLSPNIAEEVIHALNRPIRKNLPRLEARYFITVYERDESNNKTLLSFSKIDFNMLQEQHQKELKAIIEWWKSLDCTTKFPYARDRVVECYFWIMGVYFEPKYCLARKMLTKVIAVASILDDTFDNFATTQELESLTEVIQRWDVDKIDSLPEYMKMIFHSLNDVYNEIEDITTKEGRTFCVYYAKESMKRVVRYYLTEAKWRDAKYIPTMEEYMEVSLVTTCYYMLATTSFIGMGEIATKDTLEWIFNDPKIVKASALVCRLMDDIVSHEFEQERDHVASGVECYMKQYGVPKEEVIELFRKEITDAWKDINECLIVVPVPVPKVLLERILNLTRAMDVIYKDDDGYTNSYVLKNLVSSVLQNPIL